jgi:hypothetical protein
VVVIGLPGKRIALWFDSIAEKSLDWCSCALVFVFRRAVKTVLLQGLLGDKIVHQRKQRTMEMDQKMETGTASGMDLEMETGARTKMGILSARLLAR